MTDHNSWNQGLTGQPVGAHTDLNSWTAGNAVRSLHQAELARQNAPAGGFDSFVPSLPDSTPSTGGAGAYTARVSADPSSLLCAKRKNLFLGVVLCIFAGPLGLFYSSKLGAVLLLVAVAIAATLVEPELVATVWPVGALASIIWMILAVSAHNRRADATDAAGLLAWQRRLRCSEGVAEADLT